MTVHDQKPRMYSFGIALRQKFRVNSAHPDLHKWIYALCVPSAIVAFNAVLYYFVHGGEGARWPTSREAAWAADTFAAPWLSLIANLAGSVVFVVFIRHKRVRSSTRIATAVMLSMAWFFTFVGFLVVE